MCSNVQQWERTRVTGVPQVIIIRVLLAGVSLARAVVRRVALKTNNTKATRRGRGRGAKYSGAARA
jgi:hypothetical protein